MDYPSPLEDFLPEPFPETPRPQFNEPREIVRALMTHSLVTPKPPSEDQGQREPTVRQEDPEQT